MTTRQRIKKEKSTTASTSPTKPSDDHASTDSLVSNESEAILRRRSSDMDTLKVPNDGGGNNSSKSKKRVTIVRFNEPKCSNATTANQSSTHLMPPPPPASLNLKKVSITSSIFSEDLDGYLEPTAFTATADDDNDDHVRQNCFHHNPQSLLHYHSVHQTAPHCTWF